MNALTWGTLAVVGFVACAEFGSYAFVHPVIRDLPPRAQLQMEQGLLRTFGRIMPVGMTLTPILLGSWAAAASGTARWLAVAAAIAGTLALGTTIAVNVGINRATGGWDLDDPPRDWHSTRRRWDRFQGIRSWLLLAAFVLVSGAAAAG